MHKAASEGKLEVLQYLLDNAKLDLEATDDSGRTALHWAVCYDRLDCYKLLVQRGAKVDVKDNVRLAPARPARAQGAELPASQHARSRCSSPG